MSRYQRITVLFIFFLFFFQSYVYAQYWKKSYYEGIYGLGASNLMSEVGSPNPELSGYIKGNFWLTPQTFRPVIYFGGRYMMNNRVGIKLNFALANLAAADIYGDYRGTNRITSTFIIELSGQCEYYLLEEKAKRNVYRLRSYKWYKNINIPIYFFIGIGESLYFSKTQVNERYSGIGNFADTFDRPEKYNHTTPVLPFGIGVRFRLNKVIRFGIEAGYRMTITDYLDEVEKINVETNKSWPDTYQFLLFTLNYKLKSGRSGLPRLRFR